MPRAPLLLALLLTACPKPGDDSAPDTGPVPYTPPAQITTSADGWLRGDLHLHTTYSDGFDSVATVIALAEYLEDPAFLAYHPEYEGSGLDYIALTDHRTVDQNADPDFHSERLVLLPGEEFGGSGHAGAWGIDSFVDHDPDDDGSTASDYQAGIEATHAQGGAFSPNHPFSPDIMFPWPVTGFDAIEVWNCGWILASPATTQADLEAWEASRGPATATYAKGLEGAGGGGSYQALVWYEAMLARGQHAGLVGGSDRHLLVLPGFPTTYVQAASADRQGVIDGIRARHTYVTRTPASAQILGTITVDGAAYQWGDEVPVPAGGAEVTVQLRVARAEGGLARLIQGGPVASDEDLPAATLGSPLAEQDIDSQDFTLEASFTATPGDWVYPLVLESLLAPGLSEDQQQTVLHTATVAAESGEDALNIAQAVTGIVDAELLGSPEDCDPEEWEPDMLQCALADQESLASFFVPDMFDRAMNGWMQDGALSSWSMGAVASAVLFVAE